MARPMTANQESSLVQCEGPASRSLRRAVPERRWPYEAAYAALAAGTTALVLSPVLLHAGWPLNQGTTAPLLLVQMYAAHIRHLDLIPVWSSSDELGLGSPVFLLYHRAFFYLAGTLSLFGFGLKASVVLTVAIFLAVGAYGMRASLGLVTSSRLLCTVGSLGFLFTNYVFTDWLDPRGDLAEFSAVMIVPWLLYWCLNLVRNRRVSFVLIPVMVLLVNADSAIALLSLFTLAISLIIFVMVAKLAGLRAVAKRLVISVTATALFLAPILLAEFRFLHSYDPQAKNNSGPFMISEQFVHFGKYFYDSTHRWFSPNQYPPQHNFVQIDFAIWIPIVAAAAALAWNAFRRGQRRDRRQSIFDSVDRPVVRFLLASLAVYLFLQLPVSYFVYRLFSPLTVINFPWRMLAFITPIGLILIILVADRLKQLYSPGILWGSAAVLWLGSLVALSPLTSNYGLFASSHQFSPMKLFTAPKSVDYQSYQGTPLYDIFLPKLVAPNGREVDPGHELIDYALLHRHQAGAQSLSRVPCSVVEPSHAAFETLQLRFSVSCSGRTRVALPISYNDYSTVFVETDRRALRQIPYFHARDDPRILINVPTSGMETVVVHLPTLWGTLS